MNTQFRSALLVCAVLLAGAAWRFVTTPVDAAFYQPEIPTNSSAAFEKREDAYRQNNLGVALLEQFDHKGGAEAFRRALALDPDLKIAQINLAIALMNQQETEAAESAAEKARNIADANLTAHYVSGLVYKTQNRTDEAAREFQRVLQDDANDVGANVNLGQIFVQQRKYKEAIVLFRRAFDAEPYNGTALYNLGTALLRSGEREEGQKLIQQFQKLRQSGAATTIGQNYLEQGFYAEALSSTGAESEIVDKTAPKITFQTKNIGLQTQKPQTGLAAGNFNFLKPKSKYDILRRFANGATLIDVDSDGDLDLVKLNNSIGATRKFVRESSSATVSSSVSLFRNDAGKFTDISAATGDLARISKNVLTSVVSGDFDNDNLPDLLVTGHGGLQLFRNAGKNKFEDVSIKAKLPKYDDLSISTAFVDADHDGDLDVFIAGFIKFDICAEANDCPFPRDFSGASNAMLRNNGDGTFTDISETAKINASKAKTDGKDLNGKAIAVIPTDFDNRRDVDLLVVNHGGAINLFRNLRDTTFRDVAAEVGLTQTANWSSATAGDFNKDSFVDFFFGKSDGRGVFAVSDGRGKFVMKDAPTGTENAAAAQFLDYDSDGLLDLIVNTDKGFAVARNLGNGWTDADSAVFKTAANNSLAGSRQMLSGDIDSDGDADLFAFDLNGAVQFVENAGGNVNNSVDFALKGRVSNRTGVGAKIDVRAGSLAQKLESYAASPAPAPADLHFGLGKRIKPDAVRVIWTSGVVQSETEISPAPQAKTGVARLPFKIEELDRKPSSCPYLYTWNGEKFEFITDFLGGGEMGNWKEAGVYHHPDSDEFVRITSDQLKPKNRFYELRVTNELEEVLFLDNLKLVAVEHAANQEVYPNEGLAIPTAGKQILYTTENARAPLAAVDSNGKNVLPNVERLDRKFYDSFKSQNIRGYAETHELTLNLDDKKGFAGRTLLLLTGWTDYAFSSDNLAAAQSGRALFMPKLQVRNQKGEWQTVIESIGISVGRPQTLIVDLTGKFLTDSREVRIVTNFKTYYDKIAVDTSAQTTVKTTELAAVQTDLRERGFSEEIKFGEMISANYDQVLNDNRWKYFSGAFTRIGDVKPLLNQVDDVFVISKTGDELVLRFAAPPELPINKKYTFLLFADGYSKEMDINSGSPDAVFPLPFKRMKKYPYAATDEQFPMTAEKQAIYDEYTTRRVRNGLPRIEVGLK